MRLSWQPVWADFLRLHVVPNTASLGKFKTNMKHIMPLWEARPVREITKRDIIAVTDAARERGEETRNSTIGTLSSFFHWCVQRDLIDTSPVTVKKIKQPSRERVLTDAEISVFWKGCDELGPSYGPMYQMLLLTGCRLSEVAEMEWSEIDGAIWSIPGSRTKTKQPLDIALTAQMLAVLTNLPRIEGSKFVFTTGSGSKPASAFSKAKLALDKVAPIPDFVIHDLRRTCGTGLAKLGVTSQIVDRYLNHAVGGVAGIYDRYRYAPEMAAAGKLWSDYVAKITA